MPAFPEKISEETMKSEKKTFVRSFKRLIFCIIVTLLFGRTIGYCQQADEFESLSYGTDRSFARLQISDGLALEILEKNDQMLPSPLARVNSDKFRSVPVPPASVTVGVFTAVMVVGWLRRRTPSDLNQ